MVVQPGVLGMDVQLNLTLFTPMETFLRLVYSLLDQGKTPIEMDGKLRKERWPVYPDHEH